MAAGVCVGTAAAGALAPHANADMHNSASAAASMARLGMLSVFDHAASRKSSSFDDMPDATPGRYHVERKVSVRIMSYAPLIIKRSAQDNRILIANPHRQSDGMRDNGTASGWR